MAPEEEKLQQPAPEAKVVGEEKKALDQICDLVPEERRPELIDQIRPLVDEALVGTVTWPKSVRRRIDAVIAQIDQNLSAQLGAIMSAPEFQKLEGSWRGLKYLTMNSETGPMLKIRVLNMKKDELAEDLENAVEFDQSQIFKKVYTQTYDMFGAAPYGALIGDYEFNNSAQDVSLLTGMSHLAAAGYCPFLSSTSPAFFGLKDFTRLPDPRDLKTLFDKTEYIKWNAFRESEDSRFAVLTMPRVLARLPYGKGGADLKAFKYQEVPLGEDGKAVEIPHDRFCWMNAAYALGARLTDSFAKWGWCTSIRGIENGGKVEGLDLYYFKSSEGDTKIKCPTEVAISERREKELSDLGFLSLCHWQDKDFSVFLGGQTSQKAKNYGPRNKPATANAAISARLPYLMAVSRIAHYLKAIARDKIGSFLEASECQDWLMDWIANYKTAEANPNEDTKRRFPLAEAKIEVVEEGPGKYKAKFWLRPWLMLEELDASVSLVANMADLPKKKG